MRLRTINESIALNENYPPGAEHDSRAPWNQKSPEYESRTIDAKVWDEGGENEFPVKITYTYVEDEGGKRFINKDDTVVKFVNPEEEAKASSSIQDDIDYAVEEDCGRGNYEYV